LYGLFVAKFGEEIACSQKSFNKEVNRLASTRIRKGSRFEYQETPIVWFLRDDEEIHGIRPWQNVHIDHTEVDLEVVGISTKRVALKKLWLSLAKDACTRKTLGMYLTFNGPSYRSCMMVLRDVVRRHGRVPYMIVVDNGPDFHSHDFRRFCRIFKIHLRYRPKGHARVGGILEKQYGDLNTQFFHNLNGNTKLMKHCRMITKTHHPENFAEWTPLAVFAALEYFFDEIHGETIHSTLGVTPNSMYSRLMVETGERKNRMVKFDRFFLIESCPSPERGTRKVDLQRGIKVNHIWYSCPEFKGQHAKVLPVRIDPWDASHLYALIKGHWCECRSKLFSHKNRYSQDEVRYVLDEMAEKLRVKRNLWNPERVAKWIKLWNPANFDERFAARANEMRLLYEPLGLASIGSTPTEEKEPAISNEAVVATFPDSISDLHNISTQKSCSDSHVEDDDYEWG
jgi:putative transposase